MIQIQDNRPTPVLLKEAVGMAVLKKAVSQQSDLAMAFLRMTTEQIISSQKEETLGNIVDLYV